MITLSQMEALDINSAWRGVSPRLLMENAGAKLVKELCERKTPEKRAIIIAGTGNNGGDGFVAARHLINRGIKISVILLGRPRNITTSVARENWKTLSQSDDFADFHIIRDSENIRNLPDFDADVAIDAMLGTGITGAPREPVSSAIRFFNNQNGYKAAVDIPTGINPETGEPHETASKCDLTVTFHDTKPGIEQAPEKYTGEVQPVDIGIPKTAQTRAGPGDVKLADLSREVGSHKGENGRLLIVGGGSRYVGAPGLAGLAALNAGVDLVTVAVPSRVADVVNSFSPDLITYGFSGSDLSSEAVPELKGLVEDASAVLLGPGLGSKKVTREGVLELLDLLIEDFSDLPVLLDADGLKIASNRKDLLGEGNFVLTPHSGEFEIFTGATLPENRADRVRTVVEEAEEAGAPILLKGHIDICADSEGSYLLNDTGNPGMTVGGTGDVLGGIISAFLSRGAEPFNAATAGAFICGLAGDVCSEEKDYEFTASDVKEKIPIALSKAREYW